MKIASFLKVFSWLGLATAVLLSAPEARANAVAQGFVATEWTSQWPDERKRASVERTLMKRPCTAADIAGAIVFLCADNNMITAQTLVVDGGYSL